MANRAVGGTGVVAYGWWATGLPEFSAAAATAIVAAGATAIVVGNVRRRCTLRATPLPPATDRRAIVALRGTAPWLVLLAALAAWQLQAYLQHPRSAHPTLSSLANAALDTHVARTLAFTAWLTGAYQLGRRA